MPDKQGSSKQGRRDPTVQGLSCFPVVCHAHFPLALPGPCWARSMGLRETLKVLLPIPMQCLGKWASYPPHLVLQQPQRRFLAF